jgi:type II secretory pathway pseudopilin PulG
MHIARAVWLTVAVLALVGLVGLVIVTRAPGGPQARIATLQSEVVTRQAQSAAEATSATQAMWTATASALETQVAQLQAPNTPPASSPVLGTPAAGETTPQDQLRPSYMAPWSSGENVPTHINQRPWASRSGPLLRKGVTELLAQAGRAMWLEVDVRQQPQSLHRWAGDAGLQVVNVSQGVAQHLGQLHRGLAAFVS